MQVEKSSSVTSWTLSHILYPLMPFILDALIRITVNSFKVSMISFDAGTLSISIAMLCLFVNQSIISKKPIIENDDNTDDILVASKIFIIFSVIEMASFSSISLLRALKEFFSFNIDNQIKCFSEWVFMISVLPVLSAISVQKSFKLRTNS